MLLRMAVAFIHFSDSYNDFAAMFRQIASSLVNLAKSKFVASFLSIQFQIYRKLVLSKQSIRFLSKDRSKVENTLRMLKDYEQRQYDEEEKRIKLVSFYLR